MRVCHVARYDCVRYQPLRYDIANAPYQVIGSDFQSDFQIHLTREQADTLLRDLSDLLEAHDGPY